MNRCEPYKIKSIRNIRMYTYSERKNFLREAHFNVTRIPVSKVTFDMTSQGTSALSQEQVAAHFIGDEAYAGARNFYKMEKSILDVFGLKHVCPLHNRIGGYKMAGSLFVKGGSVVISNTTRAQSTMEYFGARFLITSMNSDSDIKTIEPLLKNHQGSLPFVIIELQANGITPPSYDMLSKIQKLAHKYQTRVLMDTTGICEVAAFYKKSVPSLASSSIAEIILQVTGFADTIIFDAAYDAMCNAGGFVATNDYEDYEKYMNEVVVYEGLHTYGGMAGRTMEALAVGLCEMRDDHLVSWLQYQVEQFSKRLTQGGVPHNAGFNGVYIDTNKFFSQSIENRSATFAAALYLSCGVRPHMEYPFNANGLVPLLIGRRALMNDQLFEIADAVISLFKQANNIAHSLVLTNSVKFEYESQYHWLIPHLNSFEFTCTPYTIHAVEYTGGKSREIREKSIKEAGYNTFLLKSEDVTIDFLTDSGTTAMSVEQWEKYFHAQESPSTPDAYNDLVKACHDIYGYSYVVPTHQGRAAEHIMSQQFIKKNDYVPGNMYFTTTKLHQEMAGGIFVDVIVDEAHKVDSTFTWKGNIDLIKLRAIYEKAQSEGRKLSYISFEFNVNMAGGQPVSMDNIKEVYGFCRSRSIPVFFDATRCAENAFFIQKNDPRFKNVSIKDILLEMFSYGDGATISCKKDPLSNLSGLLLFKDNMEWYTEALRLQQIFEGTYCSGGTSAADMAAHAQGMYEMIDPLYIRNRVENTAFLGKLLMDAGVPIVVPSGGHAIFLDARSFLSHLDQDEYPSQMLSAQVFIETGVRTMERGNVSKGRDSATGKNYRPALELVRLTIPRRVYTLDHFRMIADGIISLYKNRKNIKALRFSYEPEKLRFFQGRFEVIEPAKKSLQ